MNLGRYTSVTSPLGTWDYPSMIGATVKIKSKSIYSGLFGFDNDKLHQIKSIKFKLDRVGNCITSIKLEDLDDNFEWKDLEIISTNLTRRSICGDSITPNTIVCGSIL